MSLLKNYRLILVNKLQILVKQWSQLVIKTQMAGPPPTPEFQVGRSGWSLRICVSEKALGDVDMAVHGPHLKNHCLKALYLLQ